MRTYVAQYDELYAGSGALEYSMTVSGHGGPGSGIVVERDAQLAAQVWTEVPPGRSVPQANADGSSTLRPLSDESLCLTVPNARYAPGVQLTVQACDGTVNQEFLRSRTPQLVAAPCSGGSGQSFLAIQQAYPLFEFELAGSRMCVAATATTSGPLVLAACASGQQDEQWAGPF